ncbi:MAG: hypothetical protein AAF221_10015 [Pseudomonadota bacterium]
MTMKHRNIRGTMLYTSKKPERMDQRRGIEHFHFTHHSDGKTTLRAMCEIEEPAPTVLRDITYSLDERGSPIDCFVRLSLDDKFLGTGWFNFTPDYVECETFSPSLGRVSQKKAIDEPLDGFGTHPVVADGYLMRKMDLSKGPHKRQVHVYLPSPDHRGATAPLIAEVNIWAEYVGDEETIVPAGTFKTHHFRFVDDGSAGMDGQHPAYDVWVTADDDFVMVKGHCAAPMLTHYELISLERP